MTAVRLHALSRWLHQQGIPILPDVIFYFLRFAFATVLPYTASIGRNTLLNWNGLGIVIHHRAVIGDNCTIGQGVTIGGRSGYEAVPVLGNNVLVGVGAKLLGPIKIGDNATIGANAVVIKDVPAHATAVGVPAKILKTVTEEGKEELPVVA
jgi:serine O-acetyltransferase